MIREWLEAKLEQFGDWESEHRVKAYAFVYVPFALIPSSIPVMLSYSFYLELAPYAAR